MNVKDLKEKIKDLPDSMLVGNTGHYGEFLECNDIWVTTIISSRLANAVPAGTKILAISIEDAGPEPD